MKKLFIAGLIIALGCNKKQTAQLPFYTSADFTPHWLTKDSADYNSIHTIPPFSFIDQNGNIITEKTVAGKIYITDFFFTSCPGICPRLTKNLKLVQDAFVNDTNVILLSHSVTPDIDNVSVLKKYAKNYGVIDNKWHLLTGNKDSIYTIARKSYFADEDLGEQRNTSDFLHTENMLLLDKKRRIRGIYKGTSPADIANMVTDIKILEQAPE